MFASNGARTCLYAFGSNGSGQLGVGHFEDLSKPQRCQFVPSAGHHDGDGKLDVLPGRGAISKIVAGGNHTLVLLDDGTVYAAGNNSDGRCCIPPARLAKSVGGPQNAACFVEASPISHVAVPAQPTSMGETGVAHIAATWEASFFVHKDEPGQVYVCGTGHKGELGLGEGVTQAQELTLVCDINREHYGGKGDKIDSAFSHDTITCISACMNHVVLITSAGSVFGWGASRKGQLEEELKGQTCIWRPTKLGVHIEPAQLVTGKDFTFLVGSNGEQAFFGESKCFDLPLQLPTSCSFIIRAGWTFVQLLSQSSLTGFGRNDRGQLPARDMPPIRAVAAGSEHSIALLADGRLVAWGWGEHGNCGLPVDSKGNVIGKWNVVGDIGIIATEISQAGVGAGCATSFFWISEDE